MDTSLFIKEEIDPTIMHSEVKKEEFTISSQNHINSKDVEHLTRSVENWKNITWKCFYCNYRHSNYEFFKIHLQSIHQISFNGDVQYQCNDCEESVLGYASFLNHVRCVHYKSLKLCCDICNDIFSNYGELAVHREEHIENVYPIVYHCSLCEKVHSTEKELKSHIQLAHSLRCLERKDAEIASGMPGNPELTQKSMDNNNPIASSSEIKVEEQNFEFGLHVKTFVNKRDLLTLIKIDEFDEKSLYKCEMCSKTFASQHSLTKHLNTHIEDRPYKCETCSKRFTQKAHLKSHLLLHTGERPYNCELCPKSFCQKTHLTKHLLSHSEERPFKCEFCEKCFKSKADIKLHINVHDGSGLYKCETCSKTFTSQYPLTRHMRIHTGERPFKCEICSKSFVLKATLKEHLVSHSGERAFSCEICSKNFILKAHLKCHLRTHTEERPFKCEFCEKCFKRKEEKNIHMRKHTGERPYKCEICSTGFIRKSNLKTHLLSHTEDSSLNNVLCEKISEKHAAKDFHNYLKKSVENWKSITWKCFHCNYRESNYELLKIHLQSMHQISEDGDVNYQCNDCEESVTSYASFLNHIRCVHYESLKLCCDICNEILSNYGELAVHREEHIENVFPIVYHCSLCEKVHSTEKKLKNHIKLSHSLSCSQKTKLELSPESSQISMKDDDVIATQVKDEYLETGQTFQCGLCVKNFMNESDFQTHMNVHNRKRIFRCGTCSKTFVSPYSLERHIRMHTGERPFKCEICPKAFFQKAHLKDHLVLHTGERAFKCEVCLKSFLRKSDLKIHQRLHTEESKDRDS